MVVEPVLGLGRWAPFNLERRPHSTGVRVFWGRSAAWLIVLGCTAWMLVATAAFGFVKYRRGFSDVRFTHMLFLPWKLADYRHAKGEFLIRQGMALTEQQEWRAAFGPLRSGLAAVPEDREARLMVARIYLMAGRADMTSAVLAEGFKHHADQLDYLRTALGFFFGLQADETVIALTAEARTRLAEGSPARRMAATAQAYAYFNRDRYAEAEAVMESAGLRETPEGAFVAARIAWERGRREEALARLRALTAAVPEDDEIYRTLIFYLQTEERWAEVRSVSFERQLALPGRPEAYVQFILACAREGDGVRRAEAERVFFERFADDAAALLKLGEQAGTAGWVETAERVVERCGQLGRDQADAELLLLRAMVERRDYAGVLAREVAAGSARAAWTERQWLMRDGMRAVALYGIGRGAEAETLVRKVGETRLLPAQAFTALAVQLERVGQGGESLRVLRHALEIDPLHQPALVLMLRQKLAARELGDAPEWIGRLLGMRKPPADLLAGLRAALESDLYMYMPGRAHTRKVLAEALQKK